MIWAGPLAHWLAGMEWRATLAHPARETLVLHLTRGQGRALIGGIRHGLGANSILFIPKGAIFSLDLGRQAHMRLMSIGDPQVSCPKRSALMRLREVGAISAFSTILENAMSEAASDQPLQHAALRAHAELMLVWLKRTLPGDDTVQPSEDTMARLSTRFCDRLSRARADDPHDLDAHARALGVSSAHLSRACKASTGKTAAAILRELTLHQALDFTTRSEVAFQDIARHLGYGSAAYFTRAIQTATGQTPSDLRRNARKLLASAA